MDATAAIEAILFVAESPVPAAELSEVLELPPAEIGEALDAIAILIIVLLNGLIGFVQEYRAERALKALQRLSAPTVEALRDGRARPTAAGTYNRLLHRVSTSVRWDFL